MKMKTTTKASHTGATIVETVFVISIIIVLSFIIVVSFPRMQEHLALSRASYALAQNIKIIQSLALSSSPIIDSFGNSSQPNGYGMYVNLDDSDSNYVMYANFDEDSAFNSELGIYCRATINPLQDCILERKNVGENESAIYIKKINNIDAKYVSINFSVQSALVDIGNLSVDADNVEIVLGLKEKSLSEKRVLINTVGLIEVK